jgi:hypothetical protein
MARLARCKWPGFEFRAELLSTEPSGMHVMRSLDETPRFRIGSQIRVQDSEIVRWFDE